ncbi:hypothetical protein LCGC14_1040310 [marine sediment metagenome]|uniref:Uncharacterized protein n=1 Tax=marine sediment metagenome TaxID=412755 RepID=A0A0F9NDK9_9ZZZZ
MDRENELARSGEIMRQEILRVLEVIHSEGSSIRMLSSMTRLSASVKRFEGVIGNIEEIEDRRVAVVLGMLTEEQEFAMSETHGKIRIERLEEVKGVIKIMYKHILSMQAYIHHGGKLQ